VEATNLKVVLTAAGFALTFRCPLNEKSWSLSKSIAVEYDRHVIACCDKITRTSVAKTPASVLEKLKLFVILWKMKRKRSQRRMLQKQV